MRQYWIAGLLLAVLAGCGPAKTPLAKGAQYLWSQQAADGGWHSHTYGLLRSGQSLTPFVLEALLRVPDETYPRSGAQVDRAVAFIRDHTRSGALGLADAGIPDYPNYSTALAVSALARARRPGWEAQIQPMIAYLRTQQFTEQNGWHPADAAYGAWGMGGGRRTPPDTGHVDLSMTRYVLDALRAGGVAPSDAALQCARVFVERCQNFDPGHPGDADGGFFFSTTEFDTNKAGHDGKHFRSYGTTTADGMLALLDTGHEAGDARVAAAQRWLASRHDGMDVPGFKGEAYQRWPHGLAFYYSAASTQAFRALRADSGSRVTGGLERTQRGDGSWANPENLVKEDDPLIATGFAIRALSPER
ncbi:MAG TPA: prenyltransferase/squalene oxidase repeat-containing protein [Bryobacteraceae bacterium]|nr:prenyltransferase/squalene oxidase repeat-containing protein [Bryobacteraceae bacterium]